MELDGALRRLGRNALVPVQHVSGSFLLLAAALGEIGALAVGPVRTVLYRQIYFTGIQALSRIALIGLLIGVVVLTQVADLVGENAALVGRILIWVVVRELGPLFAAIVVISRSASATAAELASMKVSREFEYLRSLGISPLRYLIVPRVAGMTLSLVGLTAFFQVVTIVGGLLCASLVVQLPLLAQIRSIASALQVFDLSVSLLKCVLFGLVVSAAACFHGMRAGTSITEVPQVTTRAVMQSLSVVIVVNGLITVTSFV